jgi:hypothetical protein
MELVRDAVEDGEREGEGGALPAQGPGETGPQGGVQDQVGDVGRRGLQAAEVRARVGLGRQGEDERHEREGDEEAGRHAGPPYAGHPA